MATAVFFHAHPDDEAIATGGTMATLADAGHRVVLVLATRGEVGEPREGVLADGERLGDRRSVEARRSGELLGASRVEFLGYEDSGMIGEPTNDNPRCFWQADVEEAAAELAEILRDEQADLLTIYDDHGGYGHPDHIQVHRVGLRAAALAGVDTVFQSTMNRDHLQRQMDEAIDEADAPDIDRSEFGSPDEMITHAIDVGASIDRKRRAMLTHESQISDDSFFFKMSDGDFERAFGTEWFIEHGVDRQPGAARRDSLLT